MATTSLWRIKGHIGKVLLYTQDPKKTTAAEAIPVPRASDPNSLEDVIAYAAREDATNKRQLITGVNCNARTARQEMLATKRAYDKEGGTIAYHGYQSFREGEVTPELAHTIGIKLATELWGDRYEVLVATHVDKQSHIHNHFVINTVSFADGIKFHRTKQDYLQMRQVSDRLCAQYGLSVVRPSKSRGQKYNEWAAEQHGKPTIRGTIRADIDRAILASVTERDFIRVMKEMGYEIQTRTATGNPLKYPKLKPPGANGYFRFHTLGDGYDLDFVKQRIQENIRKRNPFPEPSEEEKQPYRHYKEEAKKATGLFALYLYYCYELHIIVKHPASVKKVSVFLRDDLRKLDRYIAQADFLRKTGITTTDGLAAYKAGNEGRIADLARTRTELRNKLKQEVRKDHESGIAEIKAQIAGVSAEMKTCRKEIRLCDDIAARSEQVRMNLNEIERQKEYDRKEKTADELSIGGRSRSSR